MAKLYKSNGDIVDVEPKNGRTFMLEELRELLTCDLVEAKHDEQQGEIAILCGGRGFGSLINILVKAMLEDEKLMNILCLAVASALAEKDSRRNGKKK